MQQLTPDFDFYTPARVLQGLPEDIRKGLAATTRVHLSTPARSIAAGVQPHPWASGTFLGTVTGQGQAYRTVGRWRPAPLWCCWDRDWQLWEAEMGFWALGRWVVVPGCGQGRSALSVSSGIRKPLLKQAELQDSLAWRLYYIYSFMNMLNVCSIARCFIIFLYYP